MSDPFDPDDGEKGKRDGMSRADEAANEHWKACWDECTLMVARGKPYFNTDDIERLMRELHPNVTTHERRAIGPRMTNAAKQEWCEKTYDTARSTYSPCHGRDKRTWRSLVYRGPGSYPKKYRPKPIDPNQFDLFRETTI